MKQVLACGLLALGLAGPAMSSEGKDSSRYSGKGPMGPDGRPMPPPNGPRPGPFGRQNHTASKLSGVTCGQTVGIVEEETEGPYWVEANLNRSNITGDRPGVPLALILRVYNTSICDNATLSFGTPNATNSSAQVDIWHSDALGQYSGFAGNGSTNSSHSNNDTFLRGYQRTDANGGVTFHTIFPGWYEGRTTHIHIRLRVYNGNGTLVYNDTTQLFFDPDIVEEVANTTAYRAHGMPDTTNDNDAIFSQYTLLNVTGDVQRGLSAEANLYFPFISNPDAPGGGKFPGKLPGKMNISQWAKNLTSSIKNATKPFLPINQAGKRRKGPKNGKNGKNGKNNNSTQAASLRN